MVKCAHCGDDIIGEPFYCSDCGQNYCSFHKEPINHECKFVKSRFRTQEMQSTVPSYINVSQIPYNSQERGAQQQPSTSNIRGTTDGTYTWYRQEAQVPENAFDPDSGIKFKGILFPHTSEFLHFIIGVSLIFTIGFLNFYPNLINTGYEWGIFMLAGFYATAFLFHEFGHRQVAIHFDLQTKFRLLTFGMILTVFGIITGLYGLVVGGAALPTLALPGAVVVLGLDKVDRTTGLCKAAGPTINLVYGTILLIASFLIPTQLYPLNMFVGYAANLNYILGAFNMIPLGILDGQNIWKWNKKVYLLLIGLLLILLIVTFIFIYAPIESNPYL
ncbi:MAG: hypothetical protein ACFFB0_00995 [Promethearchaeota archaeon]